MGKSKPKKEIRIYRIREKSTGLFSMGGSVPRFSKIGKMWVGLGPLKNHLHMINNENLKKYLNCEILETTLQDIPCESFTIQEYIFDKKL